jgi:hypothetical protein
MTQFRSAPLSIFGVLLTLVTCAVATGVHATAVGPFSPSACDREWERIKSLPPLAKSDFDAWLAMPEPKQISGLRGADMYYYLARIPHAAGADHLPTMQQRDEWLSLAAATGHKAAKAALMRLRYLGVIDFDWLSRGGGVKPLERPTATRAAFLAAAREAAEAGDPEFASVMMDTARDANAFMHCARVDRLKAVRDKGCDPQTVTQRIEVRKWAEIAAQGGNPVAKELMCEGHLMSSQGTSTELGFPHSGSDGQSALWCFTAFTSPCSSARHADIARRIYEKGATIVPKTEKAPEVRGAPLQQPAFPIKSQ